MGLAMKKPRFLRSTFAVLAIASNRLTRLSICFVFTLECLPAQAACPSAEAASSFGTWIDPSQILSSAVQIKTIDPSDYALANIVGWRLQITDTTVVGADWLLIIRDGRGRPMLNLRKSEFESNSGRRTIWTGRLQSPVVRLELVSSSPISGDIKVNGAVAYSGQAKNLNFFSSKGPQPDWRDPYTDGSVLERQAADSVGMMVTGSVDPTKQQTRNWSCTGSLIAQGLFLTAWHCGGASWDLPSNFWQSEVRENCLVDFTWDNGTTRTQFACDKVIAGSPSLDYAIVRLKPIVGGLGVKSFPRSVKTTKSRTPSAIFMIHHARSETKLVSSNCHIKAESIGQVRMDHDCDSDPGSSGAPVFSAASGALVAVHLAGFELNDKCEVVRRLNRAVWIDEVVSHACKHKLDSEEIPSIC